MPTPFETGRLGLVRRAGKCRVPAQRDNDHRLLQEDLKAYGLLF